jgi:hypothetical protein
MAFFVDMELHGIQKDLIAFRTLFDEGELEIVSSFDNCWGFHLTVSLLLFVI